MNDQARNLRMKVQQLQNIAQPKPQRIIKAEAIKNDRENGNNRTRFIAVTSGKGGVGKTNLVVNLAMALEQMGKTVLVIDVDLGMANVNVLLGDDARYTLLDLLRNNITLADVIIESSYGIKFLSGGSGIEQLVNLSYNDFKVITQKLYLCDNMVDIVLLDTGAGMGRNVLNFLWASDDVILVTTPEPTAITDAYAVMKAYCRETDPAQKIQLVVNRIFDDYEGVEVQNKLGNAVERFLGREVVDLGVIYEDRSVIKAVKNQKPFIIASPNSVAAKCVYNIASRLTNQSTKYNLKGFRGFIDRLMLFLR